MIFGMWMAIGGPRVKRKLASYSPNFLPMSSPPKVRSRPDETLPRFPDSRCYLDQAHANLIRHCSPAARIGSSLFPSRERISKDAFARRAFLKRQDGAAIVGIDHGNVEPRPLLEQLDIALAVGLDGGQSDQEEAVSDFDRQSCQRHAARLLGLL